MTARATEASSTARAARVHRALLLIAAISAMLMPSNYRGGAETPHPHGFFQFWLSEPERTHDHHHRHGDAAPSELPTQQTLSGTTRETEAIEYSSNDPAFFDTAKLSLMESPEDRPSVSPAIAPGSAASVIASVFPGSWSISPTVRRVRYPAFTSDWVEFLSNPEPPPPRA